MKDYYRILLSVHVQIKSRSHDNVICSVGAQIDEEGSIILSRVTRERMYRNTPLTAATGKSAASSASSSSARRASVDDDFDAVLEESLSKSARAPVQVCLLWADISLV